MDAAWRHETAEGVMSLGASLVDDLSRRLGSSSCNGPLICEMGGVGSVGMPWFGDGEQELWRPFRAFLYLIGLGWLFMGVNMAADAFMGAIEAITSKKKRVFNSATQRFVTVEVWNPTVANLTLMALGSSAPEILLSAVELFGNKFYAGDLGPSTIVGSAALNLFVIIAVCVCAIEGGEVRYIQQTKVYYVTASWSIIAYFWIVVVLLCWSPHVVEPIEGIITFLFFPLLVVLAFVADKSQDGFSLFSNADKDADYVPRIVPAEMTFEELAELAHQVRAVHGNVSEEQMIKIINCECQEPTSRAKYRAAAIRNLTAGKKVAVTDPTAKMAVGAQGLRASAQKIRDSAQRQRNSARNSVRRSQGGQKVTPMNVSDGEDVEKIGSNFVDECVIEFDCKMYAVLENAGFRHVIVNREGCMEHTATVYYKTVEGSAKATNDYTHTEGTLTFTPGETTQTFKLFVVDDTAFEEDEQFYVELSEPKVEGGAKATIGMNNILTVMIIDDDDPGIVSFEEEGTTIQEDIEDKTVELVVKRNSGSRGKVTVQYRTEDASAKASRDYESQSGELVFEEGENAKAIRLLIYGRGSYARKDYLRVYLTDITGGAKFDPKTDGGADADIMTVFIESHAEGKEYTDRLMDQMQVGWMRAKIGHANYADQFSSALQVNGGSDDEEEPTTIDKVLHVINLPWKITCAFIPPTDYCDGWVCFVVSLLVIGAITALISDLASLLGCVVELPDEVTAITLVALGTSLPDLFASKTAALNEPFADASVGNVTGSNCVNVFLGLGLPWTIGSIYWDVRGPDAEWRRRYENDADIAQHFRDAGAFVVKAGSLVSSVMVFTCMAFLCILVLHIRRKRYGGELGGPRLPALATAALFVCFWLIYVVLSSYFALANKASC